MGSKSSDPKDDGPVAEQLAIPWTYEDFYVTFDQRFTRMAHKANWRGSGDDAEDLLQWLWMHFYEIWDRCQTWTEKTVVTHASREIKSHAKSERIAYEESRCEYVYDRQMIKVFLAEVTWCEDDECLDIDARIDIRQAFDQLTPACKRAVFGYYALDRRYARGTAEERAMSRGLDEMYYLLNKNLPRTTASFEELVEQELEPWTEN